MKIHYAVLERGNESNPYDEWSETACGLELDHHYLTDWEEHTTCKNCLRRINPTKEVDK